MPVYVKKVSTSNSRFTDRTIMIASEGGVTKIPVPDSEVICNGCNSNIASAEKKEGYLVYLSRRELDADRPYDLYCQHCVQKYFPKAVYTDDR